MSQGFVIAISAGIAVVASAWVWVFWGPDPWVDHDQEENTRVLESEAEARGAGNMDRA